MADRVRVIASALCAALLLSSASAEARQLGDFGRVEPGVVNDTLLPAIDGIVDFFRGEPRSDLLWTDEENEMHDRIWRFLVAPHAKDWAVEYSFRTASTGPRNQPGRYDRYYDWLRKAGFASSHARYNAVGEHVAWDLGTLPGAFHIICVVEDIDRQRAVAVSGLPDVEPDYWHKQELRHAENEQYIQHFVLALDYRYQSYGYALDRLLVETPHREAVEVDAKLNTMAGWVDRAQRRDFCSDGWSEGTQSDGMIRPRVLMNPKSEGEIPK